jgi:FMN phosphatase YigB (HAD superfamily)
MLNYADIAPKKKFFIFELDGVLYPERDFYLQIYYLFANFIEYVETVPPATDLTNFMKTVYEHHGPEVVFDRAVGAFGLDVKYRENLDRLLLTAQLPFKLELHPPVLSLLQELVLDRKQIFIWTKGNPEGQLNKIRQVEWKGLGQYLRVFFADEYESLTVVLSENQLSTAEVLFIGSASLTEAQQLGLDVLSVADFMDC